MTAVSLLSELRARGAVVAAVGDRVRVEAPNGALTPELRSAVKAHKVELLTLLVAPRAPDSALDAEAGELAAVMLRGTVLGDLWLVADSDALTDQPDIIRSGLPIFFFDEIERLGDHTADELRVIGMVKAAFPTGRLLQ